MKTKEEHAEMMADNFNTLMSQYEMHEIDATETVLLGLQVLKRYLESSHYMYQTPYFKIVSLCEAAEKTGRKSRYKTLDKYFLQGCLIEGINKFSARKIKSEAIYNFINDYLGIDRSESVRSLKIFKQWYYIRLRVHLLPFFGDMLDTLLKKTKLKYDRDSKARTSYSLRHTYICMRLLEGADIYQIAKNCRTSVEMIEKHYAAHLKNTLDASAINVEKTGDSRVKNQKRRKPPTVGEGVAHEVQRPDLIDAVRSWQRLSCASGLFAAFSAPDHQLLFLINPVDLLDVVVKAFPPQKDRQPAIAKPAAFPCQRLQSFP